MYGLGLRSLSRNVAATFGRQVGAGILGLISAAIIARVFGPEGNGVFALVLLLPGILVTFLNLGVGPANVYYLGSGQVTVRGAIRINLVFCLGLAVLGISAGASVLFWKGRELFPGVEPTLLWLALPTFPILLLNGFLTSIFQGLQQFRIYNLILILQPICFLGALGLLALSGYGELALLITLYILSNLITLAIAAIGIGRLYNSASSIEGTRQGYGRKALGYGWKANLGSILGFLNYKADIFLVNFFMTPVATGIYVVAVTLAEKLWVISSAVSTVLLPRLSQLSSHEETRKRLTPLISRLVFMITALGGMLLALIAYPLIAGIFGAQYSASVWPLLLLLPGAVILGVAKVWANDIAARGRPEIGMYVALVTLVANIIGNLLLIPAFGLAGAAIATTLAYSICSGITLIIYIRMTSNRWMETLFVSAADMRMVMSVFAR
ncbi:MAG: flippase [Candidatus Thiosymbion ectosymbiont of Robbea hypermnestra]|nr:flippase [Candidatus Thiosymbion ectosymbiont of Robbea hypermnestra]